MSVELKSFNESLPEGVQLVLVISGSPVTSSKDQRHTGFVLKTSDGSLWLYHLGWHDYFCKEIVSTDYGYLVADFLDEVSSAPIMAFLAVLQAEFSKDFTYSINWEDGPYFDEKGVEKLKNQPGQGLTCATFVLESLARYGFELVDKTSWPITPESEKWQADIVSRLMSSRPASVSEFVPQLEYVGKVPRIKPEEALAAANIYEDEPLSYQSVQPGSDEVIAEMERLGIR